MRWPKQKARGSLVLVAFCLVAVIGIALASYISACYQSLNHSTRELHNRRARYLAEVGLEEALWQLNNGMTWTGSGPASATAWTGTTTRSLAVTGYALGNGATGQLAVSVNTTTYAITSTATVAVADRTYTKTLTATTQYAPQFGYAVASANSTVTFSSDGTVDSYTAPTYTAPSSSAGFSGIVAGNNVSLTNADVKGYVETYGNTPSYSASATVKSFTSPASPNVDLSRLGKSAFIPLFSITTPTATLTTLPGTASGGTITLGTATTIGTAGSTTYHGTTVANPNYRLSRNLTINGNVKMVVRGNLTVDGTRSIIVSSGSTLELFVAGNVTMTSASAAITNPAGYPNRVALYLTGTTSTITWAANVAFYGVIFAPYSTASPVISVSGNTMQFYGAIITNGGITFAGSAPQVHYDNSLRTSTWKANFAGLNAPFMITAVTETASER
jgi:hypothetical protein